MGVRIGDPTTGGGVLFTPEQGAETVRSYLKPRARTPKLDSRDHEAPTAREQALSMFAAGASLEDIARAGGKTPTFETAHPRMATGIERESGWGTLVALGVIGASGIGGALAARHYKKSALLGGIIGAALPPALVVLGFKTGVLTFDFSGMFGGK